MKQAKNDGVDPIATTPQTKKDGVDPPKNPPDFPEKDDAYSSDRTRFIFDLFQLHEHRVQFESGWIGHRLTWLVASQSFLFLTFVNAVNLVDRDPDFKPTLEWVIVSVALAQACTTYLSILSAKFVNTEMMPMRESIDSAIRNLGIKAIEDHWQELGLNRTGKLKWTFWMGSLASHTIPVSLIVGWAVLMVALAQR